MDTLRGRSEPGATYRLTVSYLGTAYGGWQRQLNTVAVQQLVEESIEQVVGEPVRVTGASRTDAGVHARGQELHLRLSNPCSVGALVGGSNHYLPADIRVMRAQRVCDAFNARAWALAKEYHYRMSLRPVLSPFEAPASLRVGRHFDAHRFRAGLALLEGRHDFAAFARSGGAHTQTWRRVFLAQLLEQGPDLVFRIVGDGFLRGMVRALVGTLLWVARGKMELGTFSSLLAAGARSQAGPSAPAKGLTLIRVHYPNGGWFWQGPTL